MINASDTSLNIREITQNTPDSLDSLSSCVEMAYVDPKNSIRKQIYLLLSNPAHNQDPIYFWKEIAQAVLLQPIEKCCENLEDLLVQFIKRGLDINGFCPIQMRVNMLKGQMKVQCDAIRGSIRELISVLQCPTQATAVHPTKNVHAELLPQYLLAYEIIDRVNMFENLLMFSLEHLTSLDQGTRVHPQIFIPDQCRIDIRELRAGCEIQTIVNKVKDFFLRLREECYLNRMHIERAGLNREVCKPYELLGLVLHQAMSNLSSEARRAFPNFSADFSESIPSFFMNIPLVSPSAFQHLLHTTTLRLLFIAHHSGLKLSSPSSVHFSVSHNEHQEGEYVINITVTSKVVSHFQSEHPFHPVLPLVHSAETGILQHFTSKPIKSSAKTVTQNFQAVSTSFSADLILPLPPENADVNDSLLD